MHSTIAQRLAAQTATKAQREERGEIREAKLCRRPSSSKRRIDIRNINSLDILDT
jgi:hypothetical protein